MLLKNRYIFQMNHALVGIYRKGNWFVVTNAFNNNMWGRKSIVIRVNLIDARVMEH